MTDNRHAVIRDAAAAMAAVLRAHGVEWQQVQVLQSRVVALLADEFEGRLFPGVPDPTDLAGLAAHDR